MQTICTLFREVVSIMTEPLLDHRFGKLADKGENPGVPCRRGSPYLYRNLSDFGIDGIKEPFEAVSYTHLSVAGA